MNFQLRIKELLQKYDEPRKTIIVFQQTFLDDYSLS